MILVVGNVLKDVYLNLDSRTEAFEVDGHGTKWLDFAFNGSEHRFFSRMSNFGGAAISLQVLEKMGLSVKISASDLKMTESAPEKPTPADSYRYILTSDDHISYLTETAPRSARFEPSEVAPEYLYIDRSAYLDEKTVEAIKSYLEANLNTALVIYLKNDRNPYLNSLLPQANLVFVEKKSEKPQALSSGTKSAKFATTPVLPADLTPDKIIYISENSLSYGKIAEPVRIERIDKLTHLSAYSIAAATILGGFILGRTVEESLKLARANLENSTLDNTLSLKEMEIISAASPESLELIAATLMARGKGILAADESGGSIKKKFETLKIPDTKENRHAYRNIFFTTENIEDYLSGIILFDETARDFMDTGEAIPDFLISHRIIPGIKVDEGLEKFENSKIYQNQTKSAENLPFPEETFTRGLDTLPSRLREYYEMGLRFAKWRAAFNLTLSENGKILTPTSAAIAENCRILAEYAKACQSAGLVPIVEPEVVYDGDYPITKCAETTGKVLDVLFKSLTDFAVDLKACILKVNMVLAGKRYETKSSPEEVARATSEVLKRHVPVNLAGVVFLSGGQTPDQATQNLAAIVKAGPYPWPLTFSFARALQDPALFAWSGNDNNTEAARTAFLDRLKQNKAISEPNEI